MYTVKQLADIAGVSIRTLHYYDEINLLKPTQIGTNGYRYYDDAALYRLQQILFYREIGLELMQIKAVMDEPGFDLIDALRSHRRVLAQKIDRLKKLINTVDSTMMDLIGEISMSKKKLFEAFSEEQQQDYEREARLQYGPDQVNESVQRWKSYTEAQKQAIMDEGNQIYSDLADALQAGIPATSDTVQAIFKRWHEHLRYFYEPTLDILRGLGHLYHDSPDFKTKFDQLHPELTVYMQEGINQYVDDLEYAEIERLLAEDDTGSQHDSE